MQLASKQEKEEKEEDKEVIKMSQVIRLQDLLRKIGNCEHVYLNGELIFKGDREKHDNPLVHIDLVELLMEFESQYDDMPGMCIYAYYVTTI